MAKTDAENRSGVMALDQLITLCKIAIGTFVAIFFIERITFKIDRARKSCRLNDPEDHVCLNCVVLWRSGLLSPLAVIAVVVGYHVIAKEIYRFCGWEIDDVIFYVIDSVIGTVVASIFNAYIIFDDDGITVRNSWWILFFRVRNEICLIPWSQIYCLDFDYVYQGKFSHPVFTFIVPKRTIPIRCGKRQGGKPRECLAFAVKKLPASKFRMAAQNRLEEMGLWPEDIEASRTVSQNHI
jgi:hypothetical protein